MSSKTKSRSSAIRRLPILLALALGFTLLGTTPFFTSGGTPPSPGPSVSPSPLPSRAALERSRIDAMLRTGHADPAWFSASILAQLPASQVDDAIAQIAAALGAYQSLEYAAPNFVAHFEKGAVNVQIHLDSENKVDTLFFKPAATTTSLEDALRRLQPARGTLSYVIVEEGRSERAALNASASLAVGSAFKLAVLNALADQIARGVRHWSDVVPLRSQWKSLPSGVLRTWPDGTPLTLATYAAEMISISDNTAADSLIRIVGGDALKPYADSNIPFLTTRQMFILKSNANPGAHAAYLAAGTPAARAAVLKRVDALPPPAIDELLTSPELRIEWFFSVRRLCDLMRRVADLPLMSINPGVADPGAFRRVAYKGGSDIGVLNLTTMVTTKRGTRICFSATVNDAAKPIDEAMFELAYTAVLSYVAAW